MFSSLHSKLILSTVLAWLPLFGLHAEENFSTQLAKDCYVLKDDQLESIPSNSFEDTKLYIVHYSHIWCSE